MIIWWMSNFIPSLSNNNDNNCSADITVERWCYLFYTFTLHPTQILLLYMHIYLAQKGQRPSLICIYFRLCFVFILRREHNTFDTSIGNFIHEPGALTDFVSQKEIHSETFFFRMKYVKTIIIKLHK